MSEYEDSDSEDEDEKAAREFRKTKQMAKEVFEEHIYKECPEIEMFDKTFGGKTCEEEVGREFSRAEREARSLPDGDLAYGEVEYDLVETIIQKLKDEYGLEETGGNFYDLGSGMGKPTFVAMLVHDFHKCVGLEILEGLVDVSQEFVKRWKMLCGTEEWQGRITERKKRCDIRFVHEDMRTFNWRDATVAFCNATAFGERTMRALRDQADDLQPGSFFVVFTKPLKSVKWKIINRTKMRMNQRDHVVFIMQKRQEDGSSFVSSDEEGEEGEEGDDDEDEDDDDDDDNDSDD